MIQINEKIANWIVLQNDVKVLRPTGHNVINCEIQCECGYKRLVRTSVLKNLKIKGATTHFLKTSCKNCSLKTHRMQNSESRMLSSLYEAYKKKTAGRKKGIQFNLTIEEYNELIKSNCLYCGGAPNNKYRMKYTDGDILYLYQGVDRIDSSKDYDKINVVPCCANCNRAKGTQTIEDFNDWIYRLTNNNLSSTVREKVDNYHLSIVGSSDPKRETPTEKSDGDMT